MWKERDTILFVVVLCAQSYHVRMVHKMRSNTEVHLGRLIYKGMSRSAVTFILTKAVLSWQVFLEKALKWIQLASQSPLDRS